MAETHTETIDFYWRPGCPFCIALRRRLRKERLPLREINIWEDGAAAARVRDITGGDETVPTVAVGSVAMVNPRSAEVVEAVRDQAPRLLEQRAQAAEPPARGPRAWLARLSAWCGR
ncbi:NrdH-redoxin [Nocardiopsis gilva YIM 90087]|uniref:NrdH-redoxin n=1 Tax=Nocardiopsis gilva YIM 90087 TaxID=1235441 RepID=A0A223S808_9ACTN|nr:glutaredoxin domain-containing protein [Nocardiopsis gilva]ASU84255.1 NrdH-redoxin [Nocardiopsis gilva YIM 90087]